MGNYHPKLWFLSISSRVWDTGKNAILVCMSSGRKESWEERHCLHGFQGWALTSVYVRHLQRASRIASSRWEEEVMVAGLLVGTYCVPGLVLRLRYISKHNPENALPWWSLHVWLEAHLFHRQADNCGRGEQQKWNNCNFFTSFFIRLTEQLCFREVWLLPLKMKSAPEVDSRAHPISIKNQQELIVSVLLPHQKEANWTAMSDNFLKL